MRKTVFFVFIKILFVQSCFVCFIFIFLLKIKVSCILTLSNAIAEMIDVQHSSVAICLENGWDATCQIISLAQLFLDPYYRCYFFFCLKR